MVVTETAERVCVITHGRLDERELREGRSATDAPKPPRAWRNEWAANVKRHPNFRTLYRENDPKVLSTR
jgi:hypothetical protein